MKLILNGINGNYLREILDFASGETERVDAAVAYATEASLLFDWCWEQKILLKFWGRFDATVPVAIPVLRTFLERRSPNYSCRLVRCFHSKVIWWRGYGAYIGSANLTQSAWWTNVEAGVFITETELSASGQALELERFFASVDRHASPLTQELFDVLERRNQLFQTHESRDRKDAQAFLDTPLVKPWSGLSVTTARSAAEKRRIEFLAEWNGTLQILRDLAVRVSQDGNRPAWVQPNVPRGAQADQFLHAHYYQRTFEGRQATYEAAFQRHHNNPEGAVAEAIAWWHGLVAPPGSEAVMLHDWGPFLRSHLTRERLPNLSENDIVEIFLRVHSILDHSRRVSNIEVGLTPNQTYTREEKTRALARFVFNRRSGNGGDIRQLLTYVLYGGQRAELPGRLWEATNSFDIGIPHVGISALGELAGWALPDDFPPRNGRTSKSLRSLGYDVVVHTD